VLNPPATGIHTITTPQPTPHLNHLNTSTPQHLDNNTQTPTMILQHTKGKIPRREMRETRKSGLRRKEEKKTRVVGNGEVPIGKAMGAISLTKLS